MTPNPHHPQPSPLDPSHDEQQLIAFHLGETLAPGEEAALRSRLERDGAFAALSETVAHTLRVFSATPVPPPDTEAAWQRLRSTLPPAGPASAPHRQRVRPGWLQRATSVLAVPKLGRGWLPATLALTVALLLAALALTAVHRRSTDRQTATGANIIHLRPPAGLTSSAEADHLDRAERWLTTVNHTTAPLDPATRAEGEQLRTENALYLHNAQSRGDLPDAAVLDRLDRVLTTAEHPAAGGLQLRLDMNTDGLLFEIRILRQNSTAPHGYPQ